MQRMYRLAKRPHAPTSSAPLRHAGLRHFADFKVPSKLEAKRCVTRSLKASAAGLGKPAIDEIDSAILEVLQTNARIAFAELGRRVGLSTPAVIERVHRLEESGVILGYRAMVDPAKVGLPVRAFIKVTIAGDKLQKFSALARTLPEVLECHRVTGAESFMVQVAVRDVRHMEEVIDSMMPYVATNTSMILASPVPWNTILPSILPDAAPGTSPSVVPVRRSRPKKAQPI